MYGGTVKGSIDQAGSYEADGNKHEGLTVPVAGSIHRPSNLGHRGSLSSPELLQSTCRDGNLQIMRPMRYQSVPSLLLLAYISPLDAFIPCSCPGRLNDWPSSSSNKPIAVGSASAERSGLFSTAPAEAEVEQIPVAAATESIHTTSNNDYQLPCLDPSILGSKFIERAHELAAYRAETGHCNVPRRYGPLGNFVNKQRQLHRKHLEGQTSSLTPERIQVLEQLGFQWSVDARVATREKNNRVWMKRYGELKDYRRAHGTCRVPSDHPNTKLVSWIKVQRREYRRLLKIDGGEGEGDDVTTTSSLTPERIQLLDAIGFEISSAHDELFEVRMAQLREYKARYGDTLVPITYDENRALAQWVSTQRRRYRQLQKTGVRPYGFSDERIRQLDDIGFVWNYRQHREDESFDEMAEDWLRRANGQ